MSAFDNSKYRQEAQQKWGQTAAYKEYEEKSRKYSAQKCNALAADIDHLMAEFAACMKNGDLPESAETQATVRLLQKHITEHCYHCTNEILVCLGHMYVADARFKSNIDKHADGTAAYIREAIEVYCK